jgi:hypothetical protein
MIISLAVAIYLVASFAAQRVENPKLESVQ